MTEQPKRMTEEFSSYVCPGDTIDTIINGITYTARIVMDEGYGIDDDDCHNVDQSVTGCDDEQFAKLLKAREAFAAGEWWYCGIIISASIDEVTLVENAASLWSIEANYPEGNNSYMSEVVEELLPEAIAVATASAAALIERLREML